MHSYNECLKYVDRDWVVKEQHKDLQIIKNAKMKSGDLLQSLYYNLHSVFSVKYHSSWAQATYGIRTFFLCTEWMELAVF